MNAPKQASRTTRSLKRPELTLLKVALTSCVLLQRFALPFGGGQVPLVLPVVLTVLAWGVSRRALQQDRVILQLYLVSMVLCLTATAAASLRGLPWSMLSITYLVVIYGAFTFSLHSATRDLFGELLVFFSRLITAVAVLGLLQVGLQLVGVSYGDPFAVIPSGFVVQGFHTTYEITYGSSILKPNGIVFLEPSFFSQFVALAIITRLYLGRLGSATFVCAAALVASFSGTGILLVIAGFISLSFGRGSRRVGGAMLAVCFVVVVAVSPIGSIFTDRLARSSTTDTSARGRFMIPYQLTASTLVNDPVALLFGRGPGSAQRLSDDYEAETEITLVFPVLAKLAYEYGTPATVVFMVFVVVATQRRVASRQLALLLLVMYLTLSGSLLQPATVYVVLVFTRFFGATIAGMETGLPDGPERRSNDQPRADPLRTLSSVL